MKSFSQSHLSVSEPHLWLESVQYSTVHFTTQRVENQPQNTNCTREVICLLVWESLASELFVKDELTHIVGCPLRPPETKERAIQLGWAFYFTPTPPTPSQLPLPCSLDRSLCHFATVGASCCLVTKVRWRFPQRLLQQCNNSAVLKITYEPNTAYWKRSHLSNTVTACITEPSVHLSCLYLHTVSILSDAL